jgi:hypothetical protein
MGFTDRNKQQAHPRSPRRPYQRARKTAVPWLEELETRLTPSITLTRALLVNSQDHAMPVPDKGEEVFVEADWSTHGSVQ